MFGRLVRESFVRNPRRKVLVAAALVVGMAVATSTLTIALEVGDRLAREFRSLGAESAGHTVKRIRFPSNRRRGLSAGERRRVPQRNRPRKKLKTIFLGHNILDSRRSLMCPRRFSNLRTLIRSSP